MRRIVWILTALALLLSGCGGGAADSGVPEPGKLTVYASFYPLYDFADKIGGEHIHLECLVPAGSEPHDWEPSTADMVKLENADLFLYNGAGLEHWVDSLLASLQNDELRVLEAAAGLTMEAEDLPHGDEEGHDHDDGHDHGGVDLHVWLSPPLALRQMEAIKELLVELDPANAAAYQENYDHWSGEFQQLDQRYRTALEGLEHREIVVAHAAFGYLCAEYGLEQLAAQGFSPDAEPDPASMARVVELARERDIRVIFFEELASPKVAEAIAREIGATTAVLNPIEGLSAEQEAQGADYLSIMDQNLDQLLSALSQ